MWRPLVRRVLLYRRSAPLLPVIPQVSNRSTRLSVDSTSRFSFSNTYHSHQSPRFFSNNSGETPDDFPSDPLISKDNVGEFDFSGMNESGGFEDEDSIFDGAAADTPDVNQGFYEFFNDSAAAAVVGDTGSLEATVEPVKENDPEKVEQLLSLLQSTGVVSGSIEPRLEGMGLALDDVLVMKVLQTPCVTGENLICFFQWGLKKESFKLTSQILDALVDSICRDNGKREACELWDLVKDIGENEKGIVSVESLNKIIAELSKWGEANLAFDVFNKVEEFECVPNTGTYYLTIKALCKRWFYSRAWSVCEKMLTADMLPDSGRVVNIIFYLSRGGLGKEAHLVYLHAKDKKIDLPRSSISFVINSLSRTGKTTKDTYETINKDLDRETVSLALEMLNEYSEKDRRYATNSFSNVIRKLCWIEDVDRAKKLLLEMVESGPPPGNEAFNYVINRLAKSENMEEALSMMKVMERRGLRPDVYTYTVVISGLVRAGEMDEACKMFDEAKKKNSKLTPVAFHTVIRGFCKLEQFDKAVNLLKEMRKYGVEPKHDEYNKLIKSLCFKALDWETAKKLQKDMKANGLALNGRTRALITAVRELQEEESTETADSA